MSDFYYVVYVLWGLASLVSALATLALSISGINEGWNNHDASFLWLGLGGIFWSLFLLLGLGMTFFHWFAPVVGPR